MTAGPGSLKALEGMASGPCGSAPGALAGPHHADVCQAGAGEDPAKAKLAGQSSTASALTSWKRFRVRWPALVRDVDETTQLLLDQAIAVRSNSSIDTPSGPVTKAMRVPGRIVSGSLLNAAPFDLSSA